MNYLVLESHLEYAIVLDEKGRFLQVVNNGLTVGETVQDVTLYLDFAKKQTSHKAWLQRLSVAAACLIIALFTYFQIFERPIAAMRMEINPGFRIEWNRFNHVIGIDPENADSTLILQDYSGRRKSPATVTRELIELCAQRGYLKENGTITIRMGYGDKDSTQVVWNELEKNLSAQLNHLGKLTINFVMHDEQTTTDSTPLLSEDSTSPPKTTTDPTASEPAKSTDDNGDDDDDSDDDDDDDNRDDDDDNRDDDDDDDDDDDNDNDRANNNDRDDDDDDDNRDDDKLTSSNVMNDDDNDGDDNEGDD